VVGTVALIQSLGWNEGLAMASPFSETLAEDCMVHLSLRENLESVDLEPVWAKLAVHKIIEAKIKITSREIFIDSPQETIKVPRPIVPELRSGF